MMENLYHFPDKAGKRWECAHVLIHLQDNIPSEPVTFVQRLRNLWTFGTCWVVVVQMSLVHWIESRR